MNTENSRKRFKKRIEFERKILTLINSKLNFENSLNGLSGSAINLWVDKNKLKKDSEIPNHLNRLSRDLMIFCDTSKSSFDPEMNVSKTELEESIRLLNQLVLEY